MKIDDNTKMSILFDYYGGLLSEKQSRIFVLYHEDNLSLSEIGEELNLSKQGVHDALKKAETGLEDLESKLELIKSSRKNEKLCNRIKEIAKRLSKDTNIGIETKKEIAEIEKNISRLSI